MFFLISEIKTVNEGLHTSVRTGQIFSCFNHAVSNDRLFKNDGNYTFFLEKYIRYVIPVTDTFAYCLMPNHFHFALRIKEEKEIDVLMRTFPKFQTLVKLDYEGFISKKFSNLFSSYAQAFNKQQNRQGTLFRKPFRRLLINSDEYFRQIIH